MEKERSIIKIKARITSIILMVTILVQAIFCSGNMVFAFPLQETETHALDVGDDTEKLLAKSESIEPEDAEILYELEEKREVDTKHFLMSDGSVKACIYPQEVHYEQDGKMLEIDNSLTLSRDRNGVQVLKNKSNSFEVSLPEKYSDGYVAFSNEDGYVEFRLTGAASSLSEQRSTEEIHLNEKTAINVLEDDKTLVMDNYSQLSYEALYPYVSLEYEVTGSRLKETIVLEQKVIRSFVFDIRTTAADVEVEEDGSVYFYDNNDQIIYSMEAPYMMDAEGAYSNDIHVALEKSNNGYKMTYTPSKAWLSDSKRVYPVRIDPTIIEGVTDRSKVADSYVYSGQPAGTDIMGGSDILNIGKRKSSGLTMRAFMRFELPESIGNNDTIVDARLHLIQDYDYTNNTGFQIDVMELTSGFSEYGVTWANQPSYDNTIIDYASIGNGTSITLGGRDFIYDTYNITKLADKWHNGGTNHGIILKMHDESAAVSSNKQVFYLSKNSLYYGSVAKLLEITYRNTVGLEDYWSYTTWDNGSYGTAYVNNYNGNLVYVHPDVSYKSAINGFTLQNMPSGIPSLRRSCLPAQTIHESRQFLVSSFFVLCYTFCENNSTLQSTTW